MDSGAVGDLSEEDQLTDAAYQKRPNLSSSGPIKRPAAERSLGTSKAMVNDFDDAFCCWAGAKAVAEANSDAR